MTSTTTAPAATSEAPHVLSLKGTSKMKIDGSDASFGDWRDDLARDGYAVVKGAVPRDRALNYADRMLSLLESL